METLDKCFENVCELDLIFHVDKVAKSDTSAYSSYVNRDGARPAARVFVSGALYFGRAVYGRNGS